MITMVLMMEMMMVMMMVKMIMMAGPWRPCGSKWAQGDTVPKAMEIHFAKILNWGRC